MLHRRLRRADRDRQGVLVLDRRQPPARPQRVRSSSAIGAPSIAGSASFRSACRIHHRYRARRLRAQVSHGDPERPRARRVSFLLRIRLRSGPDRDLYAARRQRQLFRSAEPKPAAGPSDPPWWCSQRDDRTKLRQRNARRHAARPSQARRTLGVLVRS